MSALQERMIVRAIRGQQRSYFYFPATSAKRAAQLAALTCQHRCIDDVDYFEVYDEDIFDSRGLGKAPLLIADYQGRPAVTYRGSES